MGRKSQIVTCENNNCKRTENCYRNLFTPKFNSVDFNNICFSPDDYWRYENKATNQNNNTEPVTETENTETKGE